MYKFLLAFAMVIFWGTSFRVVAQSAEKSSGVLRMEMKKGAENEDEVKKQATKSDSRRSAEGSVQFTMPMKRTTPATMSTEPVETVSVSVAPGTDAAGVSWITPQSTRVRTSESTYNIKTSINAEEHIRFVNIFQNGTFVKYVIPSGSNIRQMVLEEPMKLVHGENILKVEVITASGNKLESSVEVEYDLSYAKYYALIIAVQEYEDDGITDLDQPVEDARKFRDLIHREYNFEEENIFLLENPTKAEIIGKLHGMRSQITPVDNLLIYYAGHGYWDEEMSTGYWFPRDANRDNPVNWLPNTDLTNYLNVLRSKHTLLIADACFSGGIFKTRSAFNTSNETSVEKLYMLPSRKAMTSGTLKEVPDKSVFIEYLFKRLDENLQKYLPSEQLFSEMKQAVINNSPNIPQYGTIQNVGDEGGDFIFIRRD